MKTKTLIASLLISGSALAQNMQFNGNLLLKNPLNINSGLMISAPLAGVSTVAVSFPAVVGVSGTVLTNDGAGNLYWSMGGGSSPTTAMLIGSGSVAVSNSPQIVGVSSATISISTASASTNGILLASDWLSFNAKQPGLGYTPVNKAGDTMSGTLNLPTLVISGSNLSLNGVAYITPSTQGAGSTVLTNDGAGNLSWQAGGGGGGSFVPLSGGTMTGNLITTGLTVGLSPVPVTNPVLAAFFAPTGGTSNLLIQDTQELPSGPVIASVNGDNTSNDRLEIKAADLVSIQIVGGSVFELNTGGGPFFHVDNTGIDAEGRRISGVLDPVSVSQAATKGYVDTFAVNAAYTATTPGDWNGTPPATIQAAIDRLAACAKSGACTGTGP